MVHVPVVTIVTLLPETVQTLNVVELNVTASPELDVAVSGINVELKDWDVGPLNVMA